MANYFVTACAVIVAAAAAPEPVDYQKYMARYAAQHGAHAEAAEDQPGGAASGFKQHASGDYQQYMSEYTKGGGYEKFMGQYTNGAGDKASSPGAGFDYSEFMSKYSPGGDYSKYMSSYGKSADYQQYTQGKGKQGAGDSSQEYAAMYAGGYQQYVSKYANAQDDAAGQQGPRLNSAAECRNETELRAWREQQVAQIDHFVPEAFRANGRAMVQQQYDKRLAELQGRNSTEEALPQFLVSVESCKTEKELREWREHQVAQIKNVPKAYQHFPLDNIEKQYQKQLALLQKAEKSGQNHTLAAPAPKATHSKEAAPAPKAAAEAAPAPEAAALVLAQRPEQASADAAGKAEPAGETFMKQFAGAYQSYIPAQAEEHQGSNAGVPEACGKLTQRAKVGSTTLDVPMLLATAQMAENEQELRALHACQVSEVKANVPAAYERFALEKVDRQFRERLAQLKDPKAAAPTPQQPVLLVAADTCESEEELRAWFAHQMREVDASVPASHQGLAKRTVADAFRQRLASLNKDFGVPVPASLALSAEAPTDSARAAPGRLGWALLFVLGGLATPAFMAAVSRRRSGAPSDGYLLTTEDMEPVDV